MLALVKTPRIELTLNSPNEEDVLEFLNNMRKFYAITVMTPREEVAIQEDDEASVPFRETEFWKETTPGDLLAGIRLMHRLTQKQLAEMSGIHKVAISDYETGRRKLTKKAAFRLATAMGENPDHFFQAPNK